jgi:hypothetical protein
MFVQRNYRARFIGIFAAYAVVIAGLVISAILDPSAEPATTNVETQVEPPREPPVEPKPERQRIKSVNNSSSAPGQRCDTVC